MNEVYDLLGLLEWQKVWDWASSTTLAPFLLSQTPVKEQIEQEGITDALGATTWHSHARGHHPRQSSALSMGDPIAVPRRSPDVQSGFTRLSATR